MSGAEIAALVAAGFGASAINAAIGSGSLVSFPVLLALGVPPLSATITNSLGIVPGGLTGSLGYRREIAALRRWLPALLTGAVLGACTGAFLLLTLPAGTFAAVVPVLLGLAAVLVAVQPLVNRALRHRRVEEGQAPPRRARLAAVGAGSYAASTYGGYFSASQGVLFMGITGLVAPQPLQRLNALKNINTVTVNTVAATAYLVVAADQVVWSAAWPLALGSLAGGWTGATLGRRVPSALLRTAIVVLAVVAIAILVGR